ncbi:MAG: cupin domain-containing protein [Hyphomicrobiales bacterium]|nr:cupin domain-containing protein [Hyphomicrobiales bacterium]
MPKIDVAGLPVETRTGYPPPYASRVAGRSRKRLGDAVGLDQFGVNLTTLKPGAASALRHWHVKEDEFVYVLQGELVLVENEGETVMRPGDAAGFKAGVENGHHFVNRSDRDAVHLEIGSRKPGEIAHYPDVDLAMARTGAAIVYTRKDGSPV